MKPKDRKIFMLKMVNYLDDLSSEMDKISKDMMVIGGEFEKFGDKLKFASGVILSWKDYTEKEISNIKVNIEKVKY